MTNSTSGMSRPRLATSVAINIFTWCKISVLDYFWKIKTKKRGVMNCHFRIDIKYFLNNWAPRKIFTWCDLNCESAEVLSRWGFIECSETAGNPKLLRVCCNNWQMWHVFTKMITCQTIKKHAANYRKNDNVDLIQLTLNTYRNLLQFISTAPKIIW